MIGLKHIFRILLLSAVLAGCQRMDDILKEPGDPQVFTAIMEPCEAETRTALTDIDGRQYAKWTSGDAIAVFQGGAVSSKYILDDASKGTFLPDQISTGQTDFPANIALYPFDASVKVQETNIDNYSLSNVIFPDKQQYVRNSFAEESFVMVAVTSGLEDRTLKFKNICGGIRLQFKGTENVKVTSIEIQGNNAEVIAGHGTVSCAKKTNGNDVLRFDAITSEAKQNVTLDCPAVQLKDNAATEFIISLPPVEFSKGFTVTVNAEVSGKDTSYICTSDKRHLIYCSRILTMPEITLCGDSSLPETSQEGDYVDEYGINHGPGIEIGGVVWAPVNCGYHATDFKYGKLYQWGRKYGQGYDGRVYDGSGNLIFIQDASLPEIVEGPVSLINGQSKVNENDFYKSSSPPYDWCKTPDPKLWNSGTEENPVKTEYDPCPKGWRVPTGEEFVNLLQYASPWTVNDDGLSGRWLCGFTPYDSTVPQVFIPAAGELFYIDASAGRRGRYGFYWDSSNDNSYAGYSAVFEETWGYGSTESNAYGYSVRCVQDDAVLIPVETISLSKNSLTLVEGSSEGISAVIVPSNANHQSACWWSDNPDVATVDSNGKVTAVSKGTAVITAMAGMRIAACEVTVSSSEQEVPSAGNAVDLSSDGTANSYIVSQSGDYKFLAAKGNTRNMVGQVEGVQVLWESYGTSESPSVGDLVRTVVYDSGYIVFSTADCYREGNAVIAATDFTGTILWSWHIWMTDKPEEHIYSNGAGTMMDRNLGAVSSIPGDVGALGLLYQWGRKDPFLGASSISENISAVSTGEWYVKELVTDSDIGNIQYTTQHPTTYIYGSGDYDYDWHYPVDLTLWREEKTVNDPCPPGWRVPDASQTGVWCRAGIPSGRKLDYFDDINKGVRLPSEFCGKPAWYPATGYRFNNNGTLQYVGENGTYRSVTTTSSFSYTLHFNDDGILWPDSNGYHYSTGCMAVRCYKEGSSAPLPSTPPENAPGFIEYEDELE